MSTFQNFAGTVTAAPTMRQSITSLDQLGGLLESAALKGHTVRTVGAGHSFTPLAKTNDILLDLDGLQGIEEQTLNLASPKVSGCSLRNRHPNPPRRYAKRPCQVAAVAFVH